MSVLDNIFSRLNSVNLVYGWSSFHVTLMTAELVKSQGNHVVLVDSLDDFDDDKIFDFNRKNVNDIIFSGPEKKKVYIYSPLNFNYPEYEHDIQEMIVNMFLEEKSSKLILVNPQYKYSGEAFRYTFDKLSQYPVEIKYDKISEVKETGHPLKLSTRYPRELHCHHHSEIEYYKSILGVRNRGKLVIKTDKNLDDKHPGRLRRMLFNLAIDSINLTEVPDSIKRIRQQYSNSALEFSSRNNLSEKNSMMLYHCMKKKLSPRKTIFIVSIIELFEIITSYNLGYKDLKDYLTEYSVLTYIQFLLHDKGEKRRRILRKVKRLYDSINTEYYPENSIALPKNITTSSYLQFVEVMTTVYDIYSKIGYIDYQCDDEVLSLNRSLSDSFSNLTDTSNKPDQVLALYIQNKQILLHQSF